MVGLFGDILACTSSGWNEHTVCGGAASDVVDFVQSNALDFPKLICSRADATLVNNRMIIVCLAQNRCWLGAAYARGADSHEEGSLMLDDVASVVDDQSATSMACGPGT